MDLSTLPKRMRYAAAVLKEANAEYEMREYPIPEWVDQGWQISDLHFFAARWEHHEDPS